YDHQNMIIKKIELQGFKSFPERTKILLHPGITAIVGPNGTGKSNIVDALLWVLGGQRSRSLRGERSGDVIFNGNTKKPPLGMADVVLSLRDDDEELTINHRFFRSGESEYRLNGKQVRLKDIQDSLWKRDIAGKEYFVIEQGKIGLFLTSKPAEKRLFLEEAAGTAFYKDKKRQTQNKLENSEQNLIRLEDIIAEVSTAKNSLQRQASAALKYRKLREKIRQLNSLNYRKKFLEIEKNLQEITLSYENSLRQEKELISQLKAEEKNLGQKRREVWNLENSMKEGQKNLFALNSQVSRVETDGERETRRIEFFEEKKNKAIEDTAEHEKELLHIDKERAEAEENLKILGQTQRQKQQALKKTDQAGQASQEKLANWGKKLETLRNEYFEKLSSHTETRNEGVKVEKEKELIHRQEEKLKSQLSKERTLLQQSENKLEQNKKELIQAQKLKDEKKKAMTARQKELDGTLSESQSLQNKISELKEKKDQETHHLWALEKLEKKERSTDFSKDIPEALGLLADLIETDDEHAPLIDIFWKEETKATLVHAQDFMKILAEKEIKGNFLLISPKKKEASPISSKLYKDPQVVGLFKSRIRPRPKIKDHLSHLQEAAIVKDIKSAVQLWTRFPSSNYITLEGDLLLSSGLLKMGQKEEGIFTLSQEIKKIKNNIARIDKNIDPLTLNLKEKIEQKQKFEEELQGESALLSQLDRKIEEIEKESKYDQTEKERIAAHISLFKNEIDVFTEDRETLTKKMESVSLKAKALKEEENSLKKKIEDEEKEYADYQGGDEQRRKNFFELKAGVDLLQEKINNLNQRLQTQDQRKETLQAKLNSLQEEIQNCDTEKLKLKENIKNLSQSAKNLEEDRKKQERELARSESHLQNMKNEQEDMEKRIEQSREEHEDKKEERVKWEISKAEIDRDFVNLEESCWQDLKKSLQEVKKEIPEEKIPDTAIQEKLAEAEEKLQKIKSVNLMAEEEYSIQKKRFDFLTQQKKDLRESIDTTREAIKKIDHESKHQFMKALKEVNKNFKEVFSLLFKGGTAELKLADPSHPLESGVDIAAQPPGKKVQSISLLSGGEKCLTSLAFFFALFRYKPTPFCILDEVDAALDEINLARFLELMKKIKNQTQFILITHNVKTM
ncbi:MAG: chromosome segregation protein SMC, partial [Candidatus Aminicenantes bacterium]